MAARGKLALRAIIAILLMIAFFAFAIALAGALIGGAYFLLSSIGAVVNIKLILLQALLGVACLVAAGIILWSVVPRIDRFEPPGPEVTAADAPELFAEIHTLAAAAEQAPPAHVYIVHDVNAFVTSRGGWMGFGSRRVMGVGLPLLETLTVAELRAVIAHELGHFHGGDTKLGPWIYKVRGAIGRTIENLASVDGARTDSDGLNFIIDAIVALRKPFLWFGAGYMRVTQAISRAQEYGADALAVRLVGSSALAEGLKKTHAASGAFDYYMRAEVEPILSLGYRPPITDGYRAFLQVEDLAKILEQSVAQALEHGAEDPYDSHPPLRERVAAAMALAGPERMPDDRAAIVLVGDIAALETKLLTRTDGFPTPPLITWEDAIEKVYLPKWRGRLNMHGAALADLAVLDLERNLYDMRRRARGLTDVDRTPDDELVAWFASLVATAMIVAMLDRGWTVDTSPGRPIRLVRGDAAMLPFAEVQAYLDGQGAPAQWRARMHELELGDVELAPAAV